MTTRKLLAMIASVCGLMCTAHPAATQTPSREYPIKPVRIIVPTSPGGLLDLASRVLAQKMTEVTGQNVLVN